MLRYCPPRANFRGNKEQCGNKEQQGEEWAAAGLDLTRNAGRAIYRDSQYYQGLDEIDRVDKSLCSHWRVR